MLSRASSGLPVKSVNTRVIGASARTSIFIGCEGVTQPLTGNRIENKTTETAGLIEFSLCHHRPGRITGKAGLMLNHLPRYVELHIGGKPVGEIEVSRSADSWYFGNFQPAGSFSEFAPLFGEWSLLIHADEDDPVMSADALDELRKIEKAIDALRAELVLPATGQHLPVDQLNIDGDMIEIKLIEEPHGGQPRD